MSPPASVPTLAHALEHWAREKPDRLAFRQIRRDLTVSDEASWSDLMIQAQRVAGTLIECGVRHGDRVLVAAADPLPYVRAVLGVFWAGAVAVPLPHSSARRAAEKFAQVTAVCGPRAGLSQGREHVGSGAVPWIDLTALTDDISAPIRPICAASDGALIQFTSGSTGVPRGARLTHRAIAANQRLIAHAFSHDDASHILGWLPLNHDLGLVGNVLQTIHLGCSGTLIAARDFAADPMIWLRAVSAFRATTSGGPDSAFALLCDLAHTLEHAPPAPDLNLSSWRCAYNGAEPVRAATLRRFADCFGRYGFDPAAQFNSYGLAEASLLVTTGCARDATGAVPDEPDSGPPGLGVTLRIVDPATTRPCPDGAEGEIWVSSDCLAESYWGDPDASQRILHARLEDTENLRFLRTGDLGRMRDGRLVVGGRLDDRITHFGVKLDAHLIEDVAASVVAEVGPDQVVAFADPSCPGGGLAIIVEARAEPSRIDAMAQAIRHAVRKSFGVPVATIAFARKGQIPRTTSGKPRRHACAQLLQTGRLRHPEPIAPERVARGDRPALAALVGAALGRCLDPADLDHDLHRLGGDSLAAARLSMLLARRAELTVSPAQLVAAPSLWAAFTGTAVALTPERSRSAADRGLLGPLAQTMLVQSVLDKGAGVSALAWAVRLTGSFCDADVSAGWQALVACHASLRAVLDHGQTGIDIADAPPPLEILQTAGWTAARLDREMRRRRALPFRIGAPLVRAALFRAGQGSATLLIVAHHAICDLSSLGLLAQQLFAPRPPVAGQESLADLAAGLRSLTLFDADQELAPVAVPTDRPAPPEPDFLGAAVSRLLSPRAMARVRDVAGRLRATPAEVLLATWSACLSRMGDVAVTEVVVAVNMRPACGQDDTAGCGIAMTAVRPRLDPSTTLADMVEHCAGRLRDALAGRLTEPARGEAVDAGPATRLDAAFLWHTPEEAEWLGLSAVPRACRTFWGGDVQVLPLAPYIDSVQHGLALNVVADRRGGASLRLDYSARRFDAETAGNILAVFIAAVDGLSSPDMEVANWSMALAADAALLAKWETGPRPDGAAPPLLDRIADATRRHPAAVAIIDDQCLAFAGAPLPARIDYAMLDRCTDALAESLVARGIGPGACVALCLPRSALSVVAVLAIMKAGAAFSPLSTDDPPARRSAMLDELRPALVLCQGPGEEFADSLDLCSALTPSSVPAFEAKRAAAGDRAYVMFTSGSTGRPKGVVVSQGAIARRIDSMLSELEAGCEDVILHKTRLTFDVSLWEMFLPLVAGGTLLVADAQSERDPDRIEQLILGGGVSIAHFVPTMLGAFLLRPRPGLRTSALRHILCSGEALTPAIRDVACEAFGPRTSIWNYYGPTEAAIDVARYRVRAGEPQSPIGRPVDGARLCVVDRFGAQAAIGARGEILIGGDQLADNYLGRPDQTAAAFVDMEGMRFYRTGDLARWTRAGVLEYLGRSDDQWKIRGQRVERGEIEAALRSIPTISDAAAMLVCDADGRTHIDAHIVPADPRHPPSEAAVISAAAALLPPIMVPSRIAFHADLPLSASGKRDRADLSPILPRTPTGGGVPRTPMERILCEAMAAALGHAKILPEQSFFDLGGDSLTAIRMVAEARGRGIAASVSLLYAAPTARRLAESIAADEGGGGGIPAPDSIDPGEADGTPFPLSRAQSGLLFLSETDPDYEVYVTSLCLEGSLSQVELRRAVQLSVDRHPFLRIAYTLQPAGEPSQRVVAEAEAAVRFVDLSDMAHDAQRAALASAIESERRCGFDVTQAPMLRVTVHQLAADRFQLTLADPTMDGWCIASLATEIVECYGRLLGGLAVQTDPAPALFRRFVELERQIAEDADARAFWGAVLERATDAEFALASRPAPRRQSRRRLVDVPPDVAARLAHTARMAGTSMRSVLLAAHAASTWRLYGERVGLIAAEVTGRPECAGGDAALGVYNNILPLPFRGRLSTWLDLARLAHRSELAVMPFRRFPHAELRRMAGGPTADAVFVYTDFRPYRRLAEGPVRLLDIVATDQTYAPLTAHVTHDPLSAGLKLILDFDAARITPDEASGFTEAWQKAIFALAFHPFNMLESSRPQPERPAAWEPVSPLAILAGQVRRHPDRIAISHGGHQLSYATLDRVSGSIAGALRRRGIGAEDLVALDLGHGPNFLCALIGVLKAGAAFLPLDRSAPAARTTAIIDAARPRLILADPESGTAPAAPIPRLSLAEALQTPADGATTDWPDTIAYVLFTSGSSGRPKGVAVGRHALGSYLAWASASYRFDQGRGAALITAADVDMSLTALLGPLMCGGRVAMASTPGSAEALTDFASDPDTGVLKLTPSHLDVLASAGALPPAKGWPAQLILGGEDIASRHLAMLAGTETSVVNEYGPTEATVGCMVAEIDVGQISAVHLGNAVAATRVRLRDALDDEPPAGLPGELCVAGPQLARGYLDDPARTAAAFRPDPGGLGRLYHTGDLAVRGADGRLVFRGRIDRQVKLRGLRIELDEVEAVLLRHPDVTAAVCALVAGPDDRPILGACVTGRSDASVDVSALRRHVGAWMGPRCTPGRILIVDRMPLAVSGKVDRRRVARMLAEAPTNSDPLPAILRQIAMLSEEEATTLLKERQRVAVGALS